MESSKPTQEQNLIFLLEETMKINLEELEKMTELEREWKLFTIAENKEQLEKWLEIKKKLNNTNKIK